MIAMIIFLVSMAFTLPIFAAQGSSDYKSGTYTGAPTSQRAGDMNAPDTMVSGTIVSVDPEAQTITIAEYVTGVDRTFMDAEKNQLRDLKAGDKVNVTPQKNDPNKAEKIEKDGSQSPI